MLLSWRKNVIILEEECYYPGGRVEVEVHNAVQHINI